MNNFGVIYCSINKINDKCYIGQTVDFEKRKYYHIYNAKNKTDNTYFHNALRKYGIDNFEWKIICECSSKEELDEKEKYYIKEYDSHLFLGGYNILFGGEGGDTFTNNPHREEIRKKYIGKHIGSENGRCGTYEIKYPDGKIEIVKGLSKWCKDNNLKYCSIKASIKYNREYKGYKLKILDDRFIGENNSFYGKTAWNKNTNDGTYKGKHYKVILPNGCVKVIQNMSEFCRENNLNRNSIGKAIRNNKTYKGYKITKCEDNNE